MGAICGGDRTMPSDTPPPDIDNGMIGQRSNDTTSSFPNSDTEDQFSQSNSFKSKKSKSGQKTQKKSKKYSIPSSSLPDTQVQLKTRYTLEDNNSNTNTKTSTKSNLNSNDHNSSNTHITQTSNSTESLISNTNDTINNSTNNNENTNNSTNSTNNTNNTNNKNTNTTNNSNNAGTNASKDTNDNTTNSSNNSNNSSDVIKRKDSLKDQIRDTLKRRGSAQKRKNSKTLSKNNRNDSNKNVSKDKQSNKTEDNSGTNNTKHKKNTSSTGAKLAQSIAKSIKNTIRSSQKQLEMMEDSFNNKENYKRQESIDSNTATHTHDITAPPKSHVQSKQPQQYQLPSTTATPQTAGTNNNTPNRANNSNNYNNNINLKQKFSDLLPAIGSAIADVSADTDIFDNEKDEEEELDGFVEINEISTNDGDGIKPLLNSMAISSLHSIDEDALLDTNDENTHNTHNNNNNKKNGLRNDMTAVSESNSIVQHGISIPKRPPSVDITVQTLNQANMIIAQSPKSVETQIEELINLHSKSKHHMAKYIFLQSASFSRAGTSGGKVKENQDSYFVYDSYGPGNLFQFYGVADGHGRAGHEVSRYVTKLLPEMLVRNAESQLLLLKDTKLALKKGFLDLEMQLYQDIANKNVRFDIEYSGTTLTCGLRFGNTLYLGNLGDSRTILGRIPAMFGANTRKRMMSVPLSVDHDPNAPEERERIKNYSNAKINYDEDGYARIDIKFTHDLLNSPETNNLGVLGTFGATKEDADEKDTRDIEEGDEFLDDSEIQDISRKQAAMRKVSAKRRASLEQTKLNKQLSGGNNNAIGGSKGSIGSKGSLSVSVSESNEDGGGSSENKSDNNSSSNGSNNSHLQKPGLAIDYSNNKYIPPPRKSKLIKNLKKISSSVSRSFGDRIAHKYGGLITEPDIRVYDIGAQDCFVIWASDGIWSMLDNNEVTNIVSKKLQEAHDTAKCEDLDKVIKKLVNTANVIWNDECEGYTDDITAVIARIGKRSLLYPEEKGGGGEDVIEEGDEGSEDGSDEFEANNNMFVDIDAV